MAKILYAYVNDTLIAEKEYEFYLCFDSLLENYDRYMILCHLYDPQFFLEYYLPEISLSPLAMGDNVKSSFLLDSNSISAMRRKIRKFKMKFPSHLAGGTFRLDFVLQKMYGLEAPKINHDYGLKSMQDFLMNIYSPQTPIPMKIPVDNNRFSVDVTIESPSGPSFKDLYWGENDEIKYGVKSPSRSKTTVHQNEYLHAHLHTEGMYGMPITVFLGNDRLDTHILDNTLDVSYNSKIFFNKRLNQIFFRIRDVTLPNSTLLCNHSFKITPNLTFDSTDALNINAATTSAANVTNDPKTEDWEKCSNSLCRVDFRPSKNYDGSFGFSWFRVEDTNTKKTKKINDWSFLENIGLHYEKYNKGVSEIVQQNPNSTEGEFHKNDNMIKNHINDYQRIIMPLMLDGDDMDSPESVLSGKYLVPQMTIRKGKTAELAMYIKSKSMPEKFRFEFSNPAAEKDGYLTVNKKEWDSIKKGDTLKIECKKEFSKSVNLNIYGYSKKDDEGSKNLCGSIRILPNDIMHQRNVDVLILNVSILMRGNDGKITELKGCDITQIKEDVLHKFYDQAYFNLHVFNETVILNNLNDPYVKEYYKDKNEYPADAFNKLMIADSSAYTNNLDYYKGGKLAELMENIINYIPNINKNCYKIILMPWEITEKTIKKDGTPDYSQVSGFSINGRRITFCFEGCNDSTPTHELGHAFGLPHTFTGCTTKAKYVYEYGKTDNFMDYSHHKGVDRQSFYYWQWKTMNALME